MKNFRTKYKRFFLVLLNKILKSNKITKRIILVLLSFCIFDLIICTSDFYLFKMPCISLILLFCIGFFIQILFKKIQTTYTIKNTKRKNYSELISAFTFMIGVGVIVLTINDCTNFSNRKETKLTSSDNLESLKNIEEFLIQEKQIFIREKNNNFYYLKIFNNSYRNNSFLVVKLAEKNLLNQNIHIDLFPYEKDLQTLEKKLRIFFNCFINGIEKTYVKLEPLENSNLIKAVVYINLSENADINTVKQTVTNILLSTVQGLLKNDITINVK